MSEQPPRPEPDDGAVGPRAARATVFVLPPSTPRTSALMPRAAAREGRPGGRLDELGEHGLRLVDRLNEGIRGERPDRIRPRSRPGSRRGEQLVLGEHLDEPSKMPRQLSLRKRLDPGCRAAARHLDHEVVGESRQRAAVRDVHGQNVARVVEDGVHRVDRELELVDPAAGAIRIEDGIVASPPEQRSAPSTPEPRRGCPRPASLASQAARRAPRRASSSTGSSRPGSRPSSRRAAGSAARAA